MGGQSSPKVKPYFCAVSSPGADREVDDDAIGLVDQDIVALSYPVFDEVLPRGIYLDADSRL